MIEYISIQNIDPSCYSRFRVAALGDHNNHRFFPSMEPFIIVTLICVKSGFFHKNPVIFTFVAEPAKLPSKKKGGMQKVGVEKRASSRSLQVVGNGCVWNAWKRPHV